MRIPAPRGPCLLLAPAPPKFQLIPVSRSVGALAALAAVRIPAPRGPCLLLALLLPFQGPFLPFVDEADHQDTQEHDHCHETEHADFLEHHRPGEQESNFQIEDDE